MPPILVRPHGTPLQARACPRIREKHCKMLTEVLDTLGTIANAANEGNFVYRGEPKHYEDISSSLYREYKTMLQPFGEDGFDIRHVQNEMLEGASRYAGHPASHDLLSQLQHYGHPTNLIDLRPTIWWRSSSPAPANPTRMGGLFSSAPTHSSPSV